MTFCDLCDLRLFNVSIHINVYQNRLKNEYARKKKAKIPEFQTFSLLRCGKNLNPFIMNILQRLKGTIQANNRNICVAFHLYEFSYA